MARGRPSKGTPADKRLKANKKTGKGKMPPSFLKRIKKKKG